MAVTERGIKIYSSMGAGQPYALSEYDLADEIFNGSYSTMGRSNLIVRLYLEPFDCGGVSAAGCTWSGRRMWIATGVRMPNGRMPIDCLHNTAFLHELMHIHERQAGLPWDHDHDEPYWDDVALIYSEVVARSSCGAPAGQHRQALADKSNQWHESATRSCEEKTERGF